MGGEGVLLDSCRLKVGGWALGEVLKERLG